MLVLLIDTPRVIEKYKQMYNIYDQQLRADEPVRESNYQQASQDQYDFSKGKQWVLTFVGIYLHHDHDKEGILAQTHIQQLMKSPFVINELK